LTNGKKGIDLNPESTDVLDELRAWFAEHPDVSRVKPEIFVRKGVAYRFTLRRGDEEVSHEIKNRI